MARANPFSAPLFTLQKVEEPQHSLSGQRPRRLAAAAAVDDKYKSIGNGFALTVREDGMRGLAKGWAPTFIGYSMQGLCKFGFYEVFKILYSDMMGEVSCSPLPLGGAPFSRSLQCYASREPFLLLFWVKQGDWLLNMVLFNDTASAEFFADIALAPMEAAKVRIQTQPGYANTLRECAPKMFAEEGLWAFYKGVVPLWMRQIPYTMMKFACFERTVEMLYKYVVPKPRSDCSKSEQLVVTFVAGYIGECPIVLKRLKLLMSTSL
ncbi:hypothetical protein GOODEAATRI_027456, partial [Goodea atripinnis]